MLHAVLDAHVLVLLGVVLVGLGEAHAGKTRLVERAVVAAAQEAVLAEDELDVEARHGRLALCLEVARELPRRRVVVAPDHAPHARLALAEEPQAHRLQAPVRSARAADDVVGQEGLDVPPLGLPGLGLGARAEQSLLFARHAQEDHRGARLEPGERARALEHHRRPGGVVVGAGGIGERIQRVAGARVVVARDHHQPVGVAAGELGDHVDDFPAGGHALRGTDLVGDQRAGEAAPVVLARDRLELRQEPAPRRADAAHVARRVRQRVARAEPREALHVALEAARSVARAASGIGLRRRGAGEAHGCQHPGRDPERRPRR